MTFSNSKLKEGPIILGEISRQEKNFQRQASVMARAEMSLAITNIAIEPLSVWTPDSEKPQSLRYIG